MLNIKNIWFVMILLFLGNAINAQTKEERDWKVTIDVIQKHHKKMLDFHYTNHNAPQSFNLIRDSLFMKGYRRGKEYLHKGSLKELKQVRYYKGNGLLLTFKWNKLKLIVKDSVRKTIVKKEKRAHLAIQVDNAKVKKELYIAFKRLVTLNLAKK